MPCKELEVEETQEHGANSLGGALTFQNENCCRPQTDPCSAAMSPDVCKEQRNSVKERIEDQTGPMGGKVQDMGGGGTKKHQHANSTTFACLSSYSLYNYKNTTGWGGGGGVGWREEGDPDPHCLLLQTTQQADWGGTTLRLCQTNSQGRMPFCTNGSSFEQVGAQSKN